jgi:hypothetical protein
MLRSLRLEAIGRERTNVPTAPMSVLATVPQRAGLVERFSWVFAEFIHAEKMNESTSGLRESVSRHVWSKGSNEVATSVHNASRNLFDR